MSFIGNKILLGFDDEAISDKYSSVVDFKTNKIGGKPNWMHDLSEQIKCRLCGLPLPLVLQIYAPMNNSPYHRTLYVFACINPNCWNKDESWVCLRSQKLEVRNPEDSNSVIKTSSNPPSSWCTSSDSWGDDDLTDKLDYLTDLVQDSTINDYPCNFNQLNRDFSQMGMDERTDLNKLSVRDNTSGMTSLAVALIEGSEGDMVCIDTPVLPQNDISALLQQPTYMPSIVERDIEFQSLFIAVDEEDLTRVGLSEEDIIISKLREYRSSQENQDDMMTTCSSGEIYEKSLPQHGDKMFHRFITRLNANPGQIIRYGGYPLWLYPPTQNQFRCLYCGGESAFEMQILPTLIPKLCLNGSSVAELEFGCVYIFSCLAACWDPRQTQPRLENIVVQKEIS